MAVSIREYCEADRAQVGMIWSAAFDGGQPNPRLENPELPLDLRSPDEDSQVFVQRTWMGLSLVRFRSFIRP